MRWAETRPADCARGRVASTRAGSRSARSVSARSCRGGQEHLDERGLLDGELQEPRPEAAERARVRLGGEGLELDEVLLEHREREVEPRREVPVQDALAHAGLLRDGAERGAVAALGEHATGRVEQGAAVLRRGGGATVASAGRVGHAVILDIRTLLSGYAKERSNVRRSPRYDVVVVGTGGAGFAAAMGAADEGLSRPHAGVHRQVGRQHRHVGRRHVAAGQPARAARRRRRLPRGGPHLHGGHDRRRLPRHLPGAQGGVRRRGRGLRHHRREVRHALRPRGRLPRLLPGAARREDRSGARGRAVRLQEDRRLVEDQPGTHAAAPQDRRRLAPEPGLVDPGRVRARRGLRVPHARRGGPRQAPRGHRGRAGVLVPRTSW